MDDVTRVAAAGQAEVSGARLVRAFVPVLRLTRGEYFVPVAVDGFVGNASCRRRSRTVPSSSWPGEGPSTSTPSHPSGQPAPVPTCR